MDRQRNDGGQDLMRRAMSEPQTVNEEARTIDVVFVTENPVRTSTYSLGTFDEILSCDPKHIRKARLDAGAPVLDDHNKYAGVRGVLGVLDSYTFKEKRGAGTLRFPKEGEDPESDRAFNKLKGGILRGISTGYRVYKYEDMNPARKPGEIPLYRAIDWEPFEISLAPIQADVQSVTRNDKGEQEPPEIIVPEDSNHSKNRNMDPEKTDTGGNPPAPPAPAPVDVDAVRKAAVEAERNRSKSIMEAVRKAKLDESFGQELIDNGTTVEAARALIIDKFAEEDPNKGQRNTTTVAVAADETDKRRSAQIDALILRAMPEASRDLKGYDLDTDKVSAARSFRGMTLLELAKDCLERAGEKTEGLSKMEIVGRAITSSQSDFPVLLEGTNRRVLLANYQAVADVWRKFCMVGSVSDFRDNKRLRMGSFTNLDSLTENGEYKTKKITDADYEKIAATTKGNVINVSRQMIVNDDLSGFTRLTAMLGRAAARSIESDVFALFALNSGNGPTMVDGNPLFHASHANIDGTSAAPTVTRIDAMRVLMAQQMDKDSNDYLDIRPSIWLGPIGLGSTAKILNGSQYDPDATNKLQRPNVVNGLFSEVVDTPRLSGTAYYMLANPDEEPVFEVAFLDGVQTPFLDSKEGWTVDGMEWKVRLDYGVGAIGWRGIVKNAGA